MSANGLIIDGMNGKGFVKARTGVCGEVRFFYRPPTNLWLTAHRVKLSQIKSPLESEEFAVQQLGKRLVSWNLVYPKDHPVEDKREKSVPTSELWTGVHPWLTQRITNIIAGYEASDVDPQDSPAEKERAVTLLEAETNRKLDEILQDEEDNRVKNSSEG